MNKKNTIFNLNKLYPGDLILSTQDTSTSNFIRKVTNSDFSHISIFIGANIIFETTPATGAALNNLKIAKVENIGGERRIFAKVDGATNLIILRHIDAHKFSSDLTTDLSKYLSAQEKLNLIASERCGEDYSKLVDLGRATSFGDFLKGNKEIILNYIGKHKADKDKLLPGLFCSSLIEEVVRGLSLDPFKIRLNTKFPSPQDFIDEKVSNFKIVEDIYTADENITTDHDLIRDQEESFNLSTSMSLLVNKKSKEAKTGKFYSNEIENIFNDFLEKK